MFEENKALGRFRRKWKNNIKIIHAKIVYDGAH
jgi:hypothetical protein